MRFRVIQKILGLLLAIFSLNNIMPLIQQHTLKDHAIN